MENFDETNPAIALWLQSKPPAGRVVELGSFSVMLCHFTA
jgi:hypothetical protein